MLPIVPLHRCGPSENDTQVSRRPLGLGRLDHQKTGAIGADVIGRTPATTSLKLAPKQLSRPIDRAARPHDNGHHTVRDTVEQFGAVSPPERFRSTP